MGLRLCCVRIIRGVEVVSRWCRAVSSGVERCRLERCRGVSRCRAVSRCRVWHLDTDEHGPSLDGVEGSLCALSGGIFLGYLSSKTMSSARSQPARAAPLGAPRCGAPPARGLPGRATATARPSAPSARARPTRKPAVAREPSLCARRRLPALARERVR